MKPRANIAIGTAIGLLVVGLLFQIGARLHASSQRTQCQNNLKQIGLSVHGFHDAMKRFPAAVGPLPPEKRLSWIVSVAPYLEAGPWNELDEKEPWDAPVIRDAGSTSI